MESQDNNLNGAVPVTIVQILQRSTSTEGYEELSLVTDKTEVTGRFYEITESKAGIIFVGGVAGGFDSPSHLLYPKLSSDLLEYGFSSLRIKYRDSHNLDDAVYDVLTGISFLHSRNIDSVGLVGHSFGGAVVIRAAAIDRSVSSVVTLAAQSYGTGPVSDLGPRCSILLIHGTEDNIISVESSQHIYVHAQEPKKLSTYKSGHKLDEASETIYDEVKEWLITWVRGE